MGRNTGHVRLEAPPVLSQRFPTVFRALIERWPSAPAAGAGGAVFQ